MTVNLQQLKVPIDRQPVTDPEGLRLDHVVVMIQEWMGRLRDDLAPRLRRQNQAISPTLLEYLQDFARSPSIGDDFIAQFDFPKMFPRAITHQDQILLSQDFSVARRHRDDQPRQSSRHHLDHFRTEQLQVLGSVPGDVLLLAQVRRESRRADPPEIVQDFLRQIQLRQVSPRPIVRRGRRFFFGNFRATFRGIARRAPLAVVAAITPLSAGCRASSRSCLESP